MSYLFLFFTLFSFCSYAQEDLEKIEAEAKSNNTIQDLSDRAKAISLGEAIEEGLRNNIEQKVRKFEFQLNEITYLDAYQEFYFPKLTLTMGTSQDHFVETFYRDRINNNDSPKTPSGFVGVGFEDFTLFNWGRDYLDYLNSEETYSRNKQRLIEQRRQLRFDIITSYFNLSRLGEITKAFKKQLSHTSFIYRLTKEKLSLKKIDSQEFLQAKAEFLNAHTQYQTSLFEYYRQQQLLADLLGDDLETSYRATDTLKFKSLIVDKELALKYILKNRPDILQARTNVNNAKRSYQRVLKDNLPLPKLSLRLGGYTRTFSPKGLNDDFSSSIGSNNVEVAASLNMSWTLFGSGGFFNGRVTESAYYQKRIAEVNLKDNVRKSKVANNMIFSRISYLEKRHRASLAQNKNAKIVFDKAIDNYIAGRTKFGDIRDVLQVLINSSIELHNVTFQHLDEKVNYASVMGIDDFPGDNFEGLIQK